MAFAVMYVAINIHIFKGLRVYQPHPDHLKLRYDEHHSSLSNLNKNLT